MLRFSSFLSVLTSLGGPGAIAMIKKASDTIVRKGKRMIISKKINLI